MQLYYTFYSIALAESAMERIPLHSWEMEISIQYHVTVNSQLNDQNSIRYYINVFKTPKQRQQKLVSTKDICIPQFLPSKLTISCFPIIPHLLRLAYSVHTSRTLLSHSLISHFPTPNFSNSRKRAETSRILTVSLV